MELAFIKDRKGDYHVENFLNELAEASKELGKLEAKIDAYQFDRILVPMLIRKEAISSMEIEGTQTTIGEVLKNEITFSNTNNDEKKQIEIRNHINTLRYGADHLKANKFTQSFIKNLHRELMNNVISVELESTLGDYKKNKNYIKTSTGTTVYVPPGPEETEKYMKELISFINDKKDGINPLIKAAMIHSQFESIHPFSDGNGRIGRLLISLCFYYSEVINFPFFYMSEAFNMDKTVYYQMLTSSRIDSLDKWIKYFLLKVIVQTKRQIAYIDSLNSLIDRTKNVVKDLVNSPKFDDIIECIFLYPVLNADKVADQLTVSRSQAIRYLNILEKNDILFGDDRKRGKTFYFNELIELASRMD